MKKNYLVSLEFTETDALELYRKFPAVSLRFTLMQDDGVSSSSSEKMNFISCNLVKVIINFIPCFIAPAADGCDDCWLHDETQFLSFVNWIHVNASHVLRPQQHQKFSARSATNVSRESRWCFWFMKSQRTAGLLLVSTYNLRLNSFLSD